MILQTRRPPSSSGLGYLVLSQGTGVRVPVGVLPDHVKSPGEKSTPAPDLGSDASSHREHAPPVTGASLGRDRGRPVRYATPARSPVTFIILSRGPRRCMIHRQWPTAGSLSEDPDSQAGPPRDTIEP